MNSLLKNYFRMDHQIFYAGINQKVNIDDQDASLLDISIENQIPHLHECGGNGNCTTCRVRILDGIQNISPKTQLEKQASDARKWDPTIRLACQCYPRGDVKMQRLIWSSGEVTELQTELLPEGRAEERPIAILFCDLRNFTKLSSSNNSFDVAYMLNRFYTVLGDPILQNNGIIYQYVGDEIIGVFGTTGGSREKNCKDAVRAAIGMQYAIDRLNKIELKDFEVKLEMGIGVNYGRAFIGHLGHPTRRQFSVIGDPVNVASRIQAQTKRTEAKILISRAVLKNMDMNTLHLGESYSCFVQGKENRLELFELYGFKEMDLQLELQSSLYLMLKNEDYFAEVFYGKIFEKAPFVRRLFSKSILDQGRLLTHMLGSIVYSLARPEHLVMGLKRLGQSHMRYGVKDEYYPLVKETMLETIEEILGDLHTPLIRQAWSQALDFVTETMMSWKDDSISQAS